MKKSLFFVAALLLSSMAFAAEMEKMTIDVTADSLQRKHQWENSQYYLNFQLDNNISVRADTAYDAKTGGVADGQSGVFYEANTSPADWRMYQARVDSFFLEAANGALIDSVQFTYGNKNDGTCSTKRGSSLGKEFCLASDAVLNVGGQSKVCLYVGATSTKTNGQMRIQRFRIFYRVDKTSTAIPAVEQETKAQKIMRNGVLYIYKDGKYINVLGL